MTCPTCGAAARDVGYRGKGLLSLLGPLRLTRHYYHCASCHQGFCPWDHLLRLTAADLTPAAAEVVSLAGVQDSFGVASVKALPKLTGLRLAESTVERTTEAAGAAVGQRQTGGETFGERQDWAWHRDAEGKTCAYVSSDATGVGQQGPGGQHADGRMANVLMVYNPVPDDPQRWARPRSRRPDWQARYLASLDSLDTLGDAFRHQAAQVGMDQAERWLALSDGGSGQEEFLRRNFPRVEAVIIDFHHVAEHLWDFAKLWEAKDEAAAAHLATTWCHQLKHEGGQAVQATLMALDLRGRSATVKEEHRQLLVYFENQVHRMDYPTYRAKGWQIGSGPVESACKTVVGQRLKGGGMRWGEAGADSLCRLRALFRSEASQWDAFWNQSRN